MKTDKEWLERARELLRRSDNFISHTTEQMALQLGLEMADERAEEIARKIEPNARQVYASEPLDTHMRRAAAIARSTITKPKEPETFTVKLKNVGNLFSVVAPDEAAIRADERKKIAKMLDADGCDAVAELVRGKPKTREQVLEEALREIEPLTTNETWQQEAIRKSDIARRALEWKPE